MIPPQKKFLIFFSSFHKIYWNKFIGANCCFLVSFSFFIFLEIVFAFLTILHKQYLCLNFWCLRYWLNIQFPPPSPPRYLFSLSHLNFLIFLSFLFPFFLSPAPHPMLLVPCHHCPRSLARTLYHIPSSVFL